MRLGELTADHIGRTVTLADGRVRVVASVRHFQISNPANPKDKVKVKLTSVMLGPTGQGGATDLGEHRADSAEKVVVGNG